MSEAVSDKKALRAMAKAARAAAFAEHGAAASMRLAQHGITLLSGHKGASVSGFSAINDEIDPQPLLLLLSGLGHPLCVPNMLG